MDIAPGERERAAAEARPPLKLGLVGKGIQRSRTPRMHEAEAAAQGLVCHYALIDTELGTTGTLGEILDRAEAEGFAGVNVTYPYKKDAMALLDEVPETARRIGAVNTIVFREGRRSGHNTDCWGFAESIRHNLTVAPLGAALLIGAGGAGGAVGHALLELGYEPIFIADTRADAAEALCLSINAAAGRTLTTRAADPAHAAAAADLIVNATPVGMETHPGCPIDTRCLEPRHAVADIVYFPLETALLSAARATGCTTISGEGMAVFQAVQAFELFTGRPANAGRMRDVFRSLGTA